MKIALIGEYSGFHLELSRGLNKIGHEAHVYSHGDRFKKIKSTHTWIAEPNGYFELARTLFYEQPKFLEEIFNNYDVVQIINPDFIIAPNHLTKQYLVGLYSKFRETKAIKVLAVVGCDSRVLPLLKDKQSSPCVGCLKDMRTEVCHYANNSKIVASNELQEFVDVIIPFGSNTYSNAYNYSLKNTMPLMFPIDIEVVKYEKNKIIGDRIKVMHGLNRIGFKGTKKITDTFERLKNELNAKIDFQIPDRLPYEKYINLVYKNNVIVDQLHADALGMNALYSLAAGKVVLTSYDKKTKNGGVDLTKSPAIDVRDEITLANALIEISEWSEEKFIDYGEASRNYISMHCDARKIAAQFIERINLVKNNIQKNRK